MDGQKQKRKANWLIDDSCKHGLKVNPNDEVWYRLNGGKDRS